jgi:hypothetical protein
VEPQRSTATTVKPRPRERLWFLTKAGKRIDAELLFHGEHGVEIQFLHDGVMAYGRRWRLRAKAVSTSCVDHRSTAPTPAPTPAAVITHIAQSGFGHSSKESA